MIQTTALTKQFEGKKALDAIDFTVSKGSVFGLVGSNGSGKSTLLRLISGVYRPDGGTVTVEGASPFNHPAVKRKIAYLGDTPYFFAHAGIRDMARFYRCVYPSFDYAFFNRLIETFPLDYKARISSMSKGMQRQAALILAMSTRPEYLLLDEAFDGLDAMVRRVLKQILIQGVEDRGMTTLIASHNLRELEDLCDSMGLIHNGKLLVSGDVASLKGNLHKVQAVFERIPEKTAFSGLHVLKSERSGQLLQLIVRGDEKKIMAFVERLSPIFAECLEPSLEEMFVYELEAKGYDVRQIGD